MLESEDVNVRLYEGELLRWRPGFLPHYIPKYCVISKSSFCYFRSRWSASSTIAIPLLKIPFDSIASVRKIVIDPKEEETLSPEKKKGFCYSPSKKLKPKYQMEIFLREGTVIEVNDQAEIEKNENETFTKQDKEEESKPAIKTSNLGNEQSYKASISKEGLAKEETKKIQTKIKSLLLSPVDTYPEQEVL